MGKKAVISCFISTVLGFATPIHALELPEPSHDISTGSISSKLNDVVAKIKETTNPKLALSLAIEEHIKAQKTKLGANELFDSVAKFYEERSHQSIWFKNQAPDARTLKIIAKLASTEFDGLPNERVSLSLPANQATEQELAAFELEISTRIVVLAKALHGGRVNPYLLGKLVTPQLKTIDYQGALAKIALSTDPVQTLESYAPQHPQYSALKAELKKAILTDDKAEMYALAANMERWRWLPENLGDKYILVNIPQFELNVYKNHTSVYNSRVVVGKPATPTPLFSDEMELLVVNPYWHVPPSIASKEYLPKLKADPNYLARQGIEIVDRRGRAINPGSMDWSKGLSGTSFRQPPGNRNALGHIKFLFPNDHAVYLHDTSSRHLFGNAFRAYSHGCVRVMDPFALAEVVLEKQNGQWDKNKVKSMVGGGERTIQLEHKLPVHMAYFTRFINAQGDVEKFKDLYGYDRTVIATLQNKALFAKVDKMAISEK